MIRTDPDLDLSINKQKKRKTLISTIFNDWCNVNDYVSNKKNFLKKLFCWFLECHLRKAQDPDPAVYGSKDPYPDPSQNVTDPEHCFAHILPVNKWYGKTGIKGSG